MSPLLAAALIAGSYVAGSIPFALLIGLARGVDIRRIGSGNVGATNLARAIGRRWAIAAFLCDYGKGLAPVLAARALASGAAADGLHLALGCGLAAVLGHVFPIFLGLRGGKGVATTFGALTALAPAAALTAGVAWLALYALTRIVSIASLAAAVVFPAATWFFRRGSPWEEWAALEIFSLVVAAMIVLRHRKNIARLIRGEEASFRRPRDDRGGAAGRRIAAGADGAPREAGEDPARRKARP